MRTPAVPPLHHRAAIAAAAVFNAALIWSAIHLGAPTLQWYVAAATLLLLVSAVLRRLAG